MYNLKEGKNKFGIFIYLNISQSIVSLCSFWTYFSNTNILCHTQFSTIIISMGTLHNRDMQESYPRIWMLTKMKYVGVKIKDLIDLYCLNICCFPVVYCSTAFHSSLSQRPSNKLETIQTTSLNEGDFRCDLCGVQCSFRDACTPDAPQEKREQEIKACT